MAQTAYCEVWQAISKSLLTHFAETAVSTNHYLGINRRTICKVQLYMVFMLLQLGKALVEVNNAMLADDQLDHLVALTSP